MGNPRNFVSKAHIRPIIEGRVFLERVGKNVGCGMRTYWSAIFSSARRVKQALFAWCRKVLRSRTKAGFSSNPTASWGGKPTSEYLSQLSDVLAVFQRMSDRRRLGIKNEAEGYGLIPLTQGKFAIVDAEDYDRLNQYQWYACKCKSTYYAGRVECGFSKLTS